MKKKLIIISFMLLALFTGLFACSQRLTSEEPVQVTEAPEMTAPPTPTPAPRVLRLAHCLEQNGSLDIAADRWAERVNDLTQGQLVIEIYPQAQLFDPQSGREAVISGELDICLADIADFSERVPACELYSLPFLFDSYEAAQTVVYGSVGRQIDLELEVNCGVKPLGWAWNGFRVLYMPGYANNIYMCSGLNMRCGGDDISIDTFRLLGMNPQVISWAKTYAALEDGTVDGAEAKLKNLFDENYMRLGKAVAHSKHRLSVAGPVINAAVWDSLDENLREILQTAWLECRDELNDTVSVSEEALAIKMVALGCDAVQFGVRTDNVNLFRPYWQERADKGSYPVLLTDTMTALGLE